MIGIKVNDLYVIDLLRENMNIYLLGVLLSS